jgi:hypothetical protein
LFMAASSSKASSIPFSQHNHRDTEHDDGQQQQQQQQPVHQPTFPIPWNPHDPLPEYTREWGPYLSRPTELPEDYDVRIDPAHIFVFNPHPVTGIEKPMYVTTRSCDYCSKIRQVCSRSRPYCQRCAVVADPQRACTVEAGWVRLPGPKTPKPRGGAARASGANDDKPTGGGKKTRAIAPTPLAQRSSEGEGLPAKTRQAGDEVAAIEHPSNGIGDPTQISLDIGSFGYGKKRRLSQNASDKKVRRQRRKLMASKADAARK